MNYEKLLEPYVENGRTPGGQRLWLTRKGIIPPIVEQAMIVVYEELEKGKTFENGHELDIYLFLKAKDLEYNEAKEAATKLQDFHQKLRDRWKDDFLTELEKKKEGEGWFSKRGRAVKIFFGGGG